MLWIVFWEQGTEQNDKSFSIRSEKFTRGEYKRSRFLEYLENWFKRIRGTVQDTGLYELPDVLADTMLVWLARSRALILLFPLVFGRDLTFLFLLERCCIE